MLPEYTCPLSISLHYTLLWRWEISQFYKAVSDRHHPSIALSTYIRTDTPFAIANLSLRTSMGMAKFIAGRVPAVISSTH